MPSRRLLVLLYRDISELLASRAFWLLLLIIGPLVGQAFITAVNYYAEASGLGGGPAALPQGLTPLDGLLAPTLGAYDLAATLLLPFVVIRIVSAEKDSGALKLVLQWPVSMVGSLLSKALSICMAWLLAMLAAGLALALWKDYGGHLYAPETLNIYLGHMLHMLLTASLATAAAAVLPGAANAAIVVLGFTVGTWALDFVSAGRGGILGSIAAFTPTATLRNFEHGLLQLDVVLVLLILSLLGFVIAGIWLHIGNSIKRRAGQSTAALAVAALCVFAASHLTSSYDLSENRRNSFSREDEKALAELREPLLITAYLAGEDPRLSDYQRNVLTKLRRAVPSLTVVYPLQGRSGLFESDNRYGEIWYELGSKRATSRSTTEEIVLETIYQLAGQTPPASAKNSFSGYPLAHRPTGATWFFYLVWPIVIVFAWWARFRRTNA